jgi:hypothetical protein
MTLTSVQTAAEQAADRPPQPPEPDGAAPRRIGSVEVLAALLQVTAVRTIPAPESQYES